MIDKRFKVIGYYPCWVFEPLDHVDFDTLTHIYYCFSVPTKEGHLLPLERPAFARELIEQAHFHNIQVFLSVGGWDYQGVRLDETFGLATDTPEKSNQLIQELMDLCDSFGFDGLDIDWEYPHLNNGTDLQYTAFMQGLSAHLHAEGKKLSTAVFAGVLPDGSSYADSAAYTDEALKAVDWVNIMAYDGGDGIDHSSYSFAVHCGNYWQKTRALPKDKVVLGVPFYGRPTWMAYSQILKRDTDADQKDMIVVGGEQVCYNGVDTIRKKTAFAKENLGGVMIWEITQDTNDHTKSLMAAIHRELSGWGN